MNLLQASTAVGAVLYGAMAPAWAQNVPGQTIIDLQTRPGVTVRYLALEPAQPKAAVLLFTGGPGVAKIFETSGPDSQRENDFLIRSRELFLERALFVAIIDVPSDHRDGYGAFRATAEHAEDVAAVIADMRRRAPSVPVWLIGTSRGTISAANVAARLPKGKGADGLVLTSSMMRPGGGPGGTQTVFDFDLASITLPTLIVHHREDSCFATLFADAEVLPAKLTKASRSVIGTSKGTISAANVAARLPKGKGADGVVLTSTITRPGGRQSGPGGTQTVFDFDLASVTIPALVVGHRQDGCFATPFVDAESLRGKFTQAPRTGLLAFSGGLPPESTDCEALAAHGYFGIEREVVDAIADWILKN